MSDIEKILEERQKTHGSYVDHAAITQTFKESMRSTHGWNELTHAEAEALEMIQHKIGRILAGNPHFKDHWDDIAGYAKLVSNLCP